MRNCRDKETRNDKGDMRNCRDKERRNNKGDMRNWRDKEQSNDRGDKRNGRRDSELPVCQLPVDYIRNPVPTTP